MNDREHSLLSPTDLMAQRLKVTGANLKITDRLLVFLMARRLSQAMQVARAKHPNGVPTVRLEVEDQRMKEVAEWAKEDGINPYFAQTLLYSVINESCKSQGVYRETTPLGQDVDYSLSALRKNLLILTEKWAPRYDEHYADDVQVKKNHINYEHVILEDLIGTLPEHERSLIVDVGCATGRESFLHAKSFSRVCGYDVSPHMIAQAKTNAAKQNGKKGKVEFYVQDVEKGIPLPDNSANCVYMNHGTASDIPNIRHVLIEIRRILRRGGVFFLSFYNMDALVHQTYLPWPPILGTELNTKDHFIEVACGSEVLPVFAQAYTSDEAQSLLPPHLSVRSIMTHPTIGSVLPKNFFREADKFDRLEALDQKLADADLGAYIVMNGQKT